jgi:hypothetical protein
MKMVMEKNLFQKSLNLEYGVNWTIKEEILYIIVLLLYFF